MKRLESEIERERKEESFFGAHILYKLILYQTLDCEDVKLSFDFRQFEDILRLVAFEQTIYKCNPYGVSRSQK